MVITKSKPTFSCFRCFTTLYRYGWHPGRPLLHGPPCMWAAHPPTTPAGMAPTFPTSAHWKKRFMLIKRALVDEAVPMLFFSYVRPFSLGIGFCAIWEVFVAIWNKRVLPRESWLAGWQRRVSLSMAFNWGAYHVSSLLHSLAGLESGLFHSSQRKYWRCSRIETDEKYRMVHVFITWGTQHSPWPQGWFTCLAFPLR